MATNLKNLKYLLMHAEKKIKLLSFLKQVKLYSITQASLRNIILWSALIIIKMVPSR